MENGNLLAVVSSGDLIYWLVKDQLGAIQERVALAAKSDLGRLHRRPEHKG